MPEKCCKKIPLSCGGRLIFEAEREDAYPEIPEGTLSYGFNRPEENIKTECVVPEEGVIELKAPQPHELPSRRKGYTPSLVREEAHDLSGPKDYIKDVKFSLEVASKLNKTKNVDDAVVNLVMDDVLKMIQMVLKGDHTKVAWEHDELVIHTGISMKETHESLKTIEEVVPSEELAKRLVARLTVKAIADIIP